LHNEVAAFIQKIERSDASFQRELSRAKIESIRQFYQTAESQPPIPGAVLLFTPEKLEFSPIAPHETVGNLADPHEKFLIIDGQHRLAALHFHIAAHPADGEVLTVPAMIFDGQTENFASEMFVTINSTPTRINKSHLVDLYEKVSWATPDRKCAAKITECLYSEADSPLRYKINRLGGRSKQVKWILQAELFNEIHKWITRGDQGSGRRVASEGLTEKAATSPSDAVDYSASRAREVYERVRDFLHAAKQVFGEAWGNPEYFLTQPVTLKALLRVASRLLEEQWESDDRRESLKFFLAEWSKLLPDFRADGFYQRFAAKGQLERVGVVQKRLERALGMK
jgi:DGQHR domain-containing protein